MTAHATKKTGGSVNTARSSRPVAIMSSPVAQPRHEPVARIRLLYGQPPRRSTSVARCLGPGRRGGRARGVRGRKAPVGAVNRVSCCALPGLVAVRKAGMQADRWSSVLYAFDVREPADIPDVVHDPAGRPRI